MFNSEEFFIQYNVIKNHNQPLAFRVDETKQELTFEPCEVPEGYKPIVIKGNFLIEVAKSLVEEGQVVLGYKWNQVVAYKSPKVMLSFQNIRFLGMNKQKTPVMEIDGEKYSGYGQISKALFGYYRADIKDIIRPYLAREFDPNKLQFLQYNNYKGKTYPVFKYEGTKIKGKNGLKREFPQLTNDDLDHIMQGIETPKSRHETLKTKFEIMRFPNGSGGYIYNITEPGTKDDINVNTKGEVIKIIKKNGETISQDTAKKLFESFEN